ncbi:MAG TPA: EAL domain-containing protein [Actinomycetota bacterium]|nr:EAL domain-containing protein [Actinomycetota bacterium]
MDPTLDEHVTALDAVQELLDRFEGLPRRGRDLLSVVRADLERTEAELRDAHAKYRALVEQIPAIVYIDVLDESMSTAYVSPQIETILGVTQQAYLEDPDLWYKLLHPEDKEEALAQALESWDAEGTYHQEYRLIAPDGRLVWFRDSSVVVRDEAGAPAFLHGVMLDITEQKAAEEQAAFLAYHDKLTGLPNRAMFEELLELSLARARRHHLAVAVLCVDLDDFKLVNDSLGHEAGDDLLRLSAERLREATRETDLVARQGGDEFLLLLSDLERDGAPGTSDGAALVAEAVASRVQMALQQPFDLAGTEVYVTGSIGIALYPNQAVDAAGLLKDADAAMYQSKRTAPGGYIVHSDEAEDALGRLSFTTRLRKAVENQNWELHYQPIVDLSDGTMTGAEALIRWVDPNGGLVPPGEFIPLAEEMGLIEAIGDWVVEELARQETAWRAEGLDLELSFNLSPRQLWRPNIATRIVDRLQGGSVSPEKITVEITETAAMTDPDRTLRTLWDLHARGLRMALDDFGTGYSSLSRLKTMPVQVLKIDRSFVARVHEDEQAGSMAQAIIQLAHGLGMTPLAEGIETQAEWRFLLERGCPLGQGFFFCRPVPAADLLARHRGAGLQVVGE